MAMTPQNFAIALAMACAFIIGLAVNRGSTCAVAAARDLVRARQADSLVGFVVAIGVAGLLTLSARWLAGPLVHLVGDPPLGWPLLAGGVLLGIGATVNGACLFGTLGRIGNGELHFLAMPVGLALGFAAASLVPGFAPGIPAPNPLAAPSLAGFAMLALFATAALAAWLWIGSNASSDRHWSYRHAMLLLGLAGSIEFMLIPGATYVDAVRLSVLGGMAGYAVPVAATVAAMAGTIIAGATAGTLRLRGPKPMALLRSLLGGMLMAAGGWLIPGGNDALLLAYLPGATLGGLIAYLVMTATVITLVAMRPSVRA